MTLHEACVAGDLERMEELLEGWEVDIEEVSTEDTVISSGFTLGAGMTPLHVAVCAGQAEAVSRLLQGNAWIGSFTPRGRTAIWLSAAYGHAECLRRLLANDPQSSNRLTTRGSAALFVAAARDNADCVVVLLNAGAKVDRGWVKGPYKNSSPLLTAADRGHYRSMDILLKANANVDMAREVDGATPLCMATQHGHTTGVRMLLEANADPDLSDLAGTSPVLIASLEGRPECLALLIAAGANLMARSKRGALPIVRATVRGHLGLVGQMLEADPELVDAIETGNRRTNALYEACEANNLAAVRFLLAHNASPRLCVTGNSRLDGMRPLHAAASKGGVAVIAELLRAGADVGDRRANYPYSVTAICYAAQQGHAPAVRLLLDAGSDVNHATGQPNDEMPETPLTLLSWSAGVGEAASLATAQELAMAGANLGHMAGPDGGETAAQTAAANEHRAMAGWLNSVADFSPVQICMALGNGGRLRTLLARAQSDPVAIAPNTPPLVTLAGNDRHLLALCREVRMQWAPRRHMLYHPAHRTTVHLLLLCMVRRSQKTDPSWAWAGSIPREVWFYVCAQIGRMGWPDVLPIM